MTTRTLFRLPVLALAGAAVLGCSETAAPGDLDGPMMSVNGRSADRCVNVAAAMGAQLGLWMLDGQLVPGAAPGPVNLGGIDGWLGSVLVGEPRTHGRSSTVHWALSHIFSLDAPTLQDSGLGFPVPAIDRAAVDSWLLTEDSAVCADAGGGPFFCRVNDIMKVVDGAGIFQNAAGFMHNHGTITITDPVTGAGVGDFLVRGRICGDGVNG